MPAAKPTGLKQKLHAILETVEKVEKTGHNDNQNYDFVPWQQVVAILRREFISHRILLTQSMVDAQLSPAGTTRAGNPMTQAKVVVEYTFTDLDSGEEMTKLWHGESIDAQDKAVAQAGTSAVKYFLMKTFLLSDGEDPDAKAPRAEQAAPAAAQPQQAAPQQRRAAPQQRRAAAPQQRPSAPAAAAPAQRPGGFSHAATGHVGTNGQGNESRPKKPDPVFEGNKAWCPLCNTDLWDSPKTGPYGDFFSCRGYKDKGCKYAIDAEQYYAAQAAQLGAPSPGPDVPDEELAFDGDDVPAGVGEAGYE